MQYTLNTRIQASITTQSATAATVNPLPWQPACYTSLPVAVVSAPALPMYVQSSVAMHILS